MKKHSKIVFLSFLLCALFLNLKCKKNNVTQPLPEPAIQLTLEDVSCTEAWLKLSVANVVNPIVVLKRDNINIDTLQLTTADTTVIDGKLLPGHTYTYIAQLLNYSTTPIQARTMDTTSHNFNWQTFTLGDATGSSVLYDVAIVNDTLAWAVGAIYLIGESIPFCLAQWNGINWSLKRLYYYNSSYGATMPLYSVNGIFAFSATDVWLTPGSIFHWNGKDSLTEFSFNRLTLPDPNATVIKLWGSSNTDLYGVGNAGTIVHYNSSTWTKLESGTTLDVHDIYGSGSEILAVGSRNYPLGHVILYIQGNKVSQISTNPIEYELFSVWFVPNRHYYVIGDGIFEKRSLSDNIWRNNPLDITRYETTKIRANGINDVFVVGAFGEFLHWNGKSWKTYIDQTGLTNGSYTSIGIKGNLIVAVGGNNAKAVITMGRRQ